LSGLKKNSTWDLEKRKNWIDPENSTLTIEKQLELSGITKSTYYYKTVPESIENLAVMEKIDRIYTDHPYYGSRRMLIELKKSGLLINRKRISRLMKQMGVEAMYQKPNLSKANKVHKKYPYLLRNFTPSAPNQVWSVDITYIPLKTGFLYLVAIIDWYSRYIISWRISNTLDSRFCLEALKEALQSESPEIFNSDQGVQFTSEIFTSVLEKKGVKISMDGKGRAIDNIFIERFWRSLKYEDIYIKRYENGKEASTGIASYIAFYNSRRPHQSLRYRTPLEMHFAA